MNTIVKINQLGFSLNINKNENYSFSTGEREFLCLNKRLIEIGIGACVAYSAANIFHKTTYTDLQDRLYMAVGFASSLKIAGYEGLKFMLLTSSLFQVGLDPLDGFTLFPTLNAFLVINFFIGQGLVLTISSYALIVGLSFLIKKYGNEYLNTLLDHFNNRQNTVTMGALEIKNNLQYQLSILGRDILCLKKIVLQIGAIIGFFIALAIEFSFQGRIEGYLGILIHTVGLLILHKMLKNKIYILPALVGTFSLLNPSNYGTYWSACEFLISTFAEGVMLEVAFFTLLSYLTKKSGNKGVSALGKVFNQLKDNKKKIEHDKFISDQKLLIDERKAFINARNNVINKNNESSNLFINNTESNSSTNYFKKPTAITEKIKTRKSNSNQNNHKISERKVTSSNPETQRKYSVNLGTKSRKTWDRLFDITKSKPDNHAIKGRKIEKLITALGGETKPGNKNKIDIYFSGKKLDNYEVDHERNKGLLSSGFAQRVKNAIEKAITSGYIDENIVKVVA